MKKLPRFIALAAAALAIPVHAGVLTDLWYDPQESGWGLSIVQHEETSFVTIFSYGPDGAPAWYAAPDAHLVTVTGADGLPSFSGALYRFTGPAQGTAFDPSRVVGTPVGLVRVDPLSTDKIRVKYQVGDTFVVHDLVRLTLQQPMPGPFYTGNFNLHQSTVDGRLVGVLPLQADITFVIDGGTATLVAHDQLGRSCDYRGAYVQAGKLGRFAGDFSCSVGRDGIAAIVGAFEFSQLEVTANGVTGRLRTTSASGMQDGRFAAVAP